jgi:hypothetical protein
VSTLQLRAQFIFYKLIIVIVRSMEKIGNLILDDLEVPVSMRKYATVIPLSYKSQSVDLTTGLVSIFRHSPVSIIYICMFKYFHTDHS